MGIQPMAVDGLIAVRSNFGPADTMKRLEADVRARGLTAFAHIDHAAGAEQALRSTDLLIFRKVKGRTPLIQVTQTSGIGLPLKALGWQDESGTTWLSYDDPDWVAKRHWLGHNVDAANPRGDGRHGGNRESGNDLTIAMCRLMPLHLPSVVFHDPPLQ